MERSWRIDRRNWPGWITPRFNVAPTTVVPIVQRAADGAVELLGARWGLIPSWWKKDTPPNLTFNARSEDAAWLDAATTPEAVAQLIAAARQDFTGYPVSPRVGDSRNDSADLLDRVEGPASSD
jgi:putative SOS response-associated peptidase YedK